jgi:aryl-phospho-beta-D-glucosidase BglC (GH1 family)
MVAMVVGACALLLSLHSIGQAATDPFLKATGVYVRNGHGGGDIVPLRGVNIGGWLLMEGWMCPLNSTTNLPDNYSVIQTLDSRFGVSTETNLIATYQNTWITTNDLDNIKALGMNLIHLPVWWANFETLSGTWRSDAFSKVDWLVTNAWQRGIYTIIDLHGVPGGQSVSPDTGQQNLNQYWSNTNDQAQTALIWQNIVTHYNGNPAIAGYDLINEPIGTPNSAAVWSAYNTLYQAIRAIDADHIIVMQGTWGNWDWDMLPNPSTYGWTNIMYEMHEYQWDSTTDPAAIEAGAANQVTDFQNHQSWNVPDFIGEFNEFTAGANPTSVWQYAIQQWDNNNINWSVWSYKTAQSLNPNSWGVYNPTHWPTTPNNQTASSATISNDWSQWSTTSAFAVNPMLQYALGGPLAVADSYNATSGITLSVGAASGVLANDTDINLGQPGIQLTAVWVDGPSNGQLTLHLDGSFAYTPPNFVGTDTFRYQVFDGYVNSVSPATVTIQVGLPAGFASWQAYYFVETNSPSAAPGADPDGDGTSNLQEFLAGTDPTNGGSYFHISSLVPNGNDLLATWMCGAGKTNVLQAVSAVGGVYSDITANIVLTGAGVITTNYLVAGALSPSSAGGSDNASDPAYSGANFNAANGGNGFGAWSVSPSGNTSTAGWFIGSSTTNGFGSSGGIDSSGNKSWGSYASGGATASAVRAFSSGALLVGQRFSVDMDNGWVETNDSVGVDLQNSSGQTLLEISYLGFNPTGTYGSTDAGGQHNLGIPFTDGGVHLSFVLTSASAYSATISQTGGTNVVFAGSLQNPSGGQAITRIKLFNNNAGGGYSGANWEAFWNNLQVGAVTNNSIYRVRLVP